MNVAVQLLVAVSLNATTHAAPAAKPAASSHKVPAKKKRPPAPMYPARTPVQTAIVVSQVRLSWTPEDKTRLRVRYRLAPPEGACPKGLHLFVPLGLPGNPMSFAARWTASGGESTAVPFERAPLLQSWAHALAGPVNTAGVVVHLSRAQIDPWCAGAEARLELEQEFPTPRSDALGRRTVVVPMRAGSFGPLGLEHIDSLDTNSGEPRALASVATWCSGAEVGPLLRSNALLPSADDAQLPALSTRRPQDDLCVTIDGATAVPPTQPMPAQP